MKTKPIVVSAYLEIATLDLEQALERFMALYQARGVKIAPDFATRIRELWERNRGKIEQTARNLRYNAVAVIPGNLKLPDFHEQMTQGYQLTLESPSFKEGGSWSGIKDFWAETPQIVLFHDCLELDGHPLIKPLLGQSLVQITGLSEAKLNGRIAQGRLTVGGQQRTFDGLSVREYLAIQAEVYQRTGNHLDTRTVSWLIASYCGRRVPGLDWNPENGQLFAYAFGPGDRTFNLAPRPAAVFV